MLDVDLNDDQLKLVHYRILFVKRDYEVAFPHHDSLVHDNINSGAFAAWKVAEFIERIHSLPVPEKWGGGCNPCKRPRYPHDARWCNKTGRWVIGKLDDDDYKYLRVSYEVTDRYPRQALQYEEDHLTVLRDIRDRLPSSRKTHRDYDERHHEHQCGSHQHEMHNCEGHEAHSHSPAEASCHDHSHADPGQHHHRHEPKHHRECCGDDDVPFRLH